ncbi:RecB-like helicase [Sulfurospirillum arcachonense]|uniref:RecB-like helicase n=1 Tax=Sulfurospirillum arcachonense TaxID=57666 RepID=UPI0004B8740D|nr:RecB-like helicase [Sulfurospirillum arcachonense]
MSMFEPYLALEASAGSGKTYALSVRYISLLYLGASPAKILTLTFTNKAAAEMKSRICDVLKELENRSELEAISEQVGLTCKELLERKEEVLEKFLKEDLLISTIDSFFAKILRKFALNAGFMPDFKIETNSLENEVLEKFLRICIQEKKYNSLLKFSINEQKKLSDIFSLLDEFYDKESEFDPKKIQTTLHVNPKQVLSILNELKELFAKEGAKEGVLKTFEAESISEVVKKKYLAKDDLAYWQYKKHVTPQISELFDELKEVLSTYLNEREKYLLGELSELFYIYKYAIRSLNKELSTLSFSDVTNALYTLLEDEISKDFLYFRLDGKIEHILIDEFQDTNIMQYKILAPLMSEIVSGVGASEFKSLFFVGDIKQSIYRFRGGAKELFKHAREEFGVKRDVLDTNYRSAINVVEYVNDIFVHEIKGYERQLVKSKEEGYVEVGFSESIEEMVLQKVTFLLDEGVEAKDIAILTHQNKDAKTLKNVLIQNIKDINVQTEATIKLISVPIVGAIIDLLKYAYFKEELYKQNFLVAIGFDWREKLDMSWLNLNQTPMKMIISIVKRYEIFEDDMDIIKLIELSSRYSDIESFLFECDEFGEDAKSEDNDGVKILTIHKSKGLEFEHVIVADRLGSPRGGGGTLLYEYDDINLVGIYQRVSQREFIDKKYENAKAKEDVLEKEDVLNMHYVAFTRAESSLIVCAKEQKSAFKHLTLEEVRKGSVHVKQKSFASQKVLVSMNQTLESYGTQESTKTLEEDSSEADHFAITYGLAMHFCLEMMSGFNKESLDKAFVCTCNKYRVVLSMSELESIYSRITMLINNEEFLSLVKNGKFYKEQPLVYNGERKQIDLLVEKDDEVIVIDYKSSADVYDSHLAQIGIYKEAMLSIYAKEVSCYLVYLQENDIKLRKS